MESWIFYGSVISDHNLSMWCYSMLALKEMIIGHQGIKKFTPKEANKKNIWIPDVCEKGRSLDFA